MSETFMGPDSLRFEELLPFYITGTLSGADQSFMQSFISINPSARQAMNFTLELGRIIRSTGMTRNANLTLNRLLANFNASRKTDSKGVLSKLQAIGRKSSPPLIIAVVILGGQAVNYAVNHFDNKEVSGAPTAQSNARVAVTLKEGSNAAALAVIAQKFGGKIIHTSTIEGVTKFFVEIGERTQLQAFIDALVGSGFVESAAVLF